MKSPICSAILLYLLVFSLPVVAQDESPITAETAPAAKARAKEIRAAAQKRYEAEKAECNTRMIAIGCLSAAQDRRAESVKQAEALQLGANRVERAAREAKLAEKEARRAAREKEEASVRPGHEASFREQEAQRAAQREKRLADEQAKLENQRGKVAAEREAKLRQIDERRREDARRAAAAPENARKRAERERKHAEKVKKIDQRQRDYAEKLKYREAQKSADEAHRARAENRRRLHARHGRG